MRVVIVGGGWAQLALAARLAARGNQLELVIASGTLPYPVPAAPLPPGCQPVPNRVLVPAALRELFGRTGGELGTEVEITACDPATFLHLPDGQVLAQPGAGVGASVAAVGAARGSAAGSQWRELLRLGADIWKALRHGDPPDTGGLHGGLSQPQGLAGLTDGLDPAVHALAQAPVLACGLDPGTQPSHAIALAYLEATFGVWQVAGGIPALHAALRTHVGRVGGIIHDGITENGGVEVSATDDTLVVRTAAKEFPADLVVVGPAPGPAGTITIGAGGDPGPGYHSWVHRLQDAWMEPSGELVVQRSAVAAAGSRSDPAAAPAVCPPHHPAIIDLARIGVGLSASRSARTEGTDVAWAAVAGVPWAGMTGELIAAEVAARAISRVGAPTRRAGH